FYVYLQIINASKYKYCVICIIVKIFRYVCGYTYFMFKYHMNKKKIVQNILVCHLAPMHKLSIIYYINNNHLCHENFFHVKRDERRTSELNLTIKRMCHGVNEASVRVRWTWNLLVCIRIHFPRARNPGRLVSPVPKVLPGTNMCLLANFINDLLQQIREFLNDSHGLARSQRHTVHGRSRIVPGSTQPVRSLA
ncbi:hypothetical protein AGLY_006641, partial [Aphis glycines]